MKNACASTCWFLCLSQHHPRPPPLPSRIPYFLQENHPPPPPRTRPQIRKLEKAVAVRNSLLESFSGKFRRCGKIIHRFSGSTKCCACQGLGIFRQRKLLPENRPRLRERSWICSSETATTFLSFSDQTPSSRTPIGTPTPLREPPR